MLSVHDALHLSRGTSAEARTPSSGGRNPAGGASDPQRRERPARGGTLCRHRDRPGWAQSRHARVRRYGRGDPQSLFLGGSSRQLCSHGLLDRSAVATATGIHGAEGGGGLAAARMGGYRSAVSRDIARAEGDQGEGQRQDLHQCDERPLRRRHTFIRPPEVDSVKSKEGPQSEVVGGIGQPTPNKSRLQRYLTLPTVTFLHQRGRSSTRGIVPQPEKGSSRKKKRSVTAELRCVPPAALLAIPW